MSNRNHQGVSLSPEKSILTPPEPEPEREIVDRWRGDPKKPVVSILCITYNQAPYLEDAIKSFLAQDTEFPFEIWIHDDASTDGTREIVERYLTTYPKIVRAVLQKDNQYSQGYRPSKFLRDVPKGTYCALCEGDDYWLSTKKLAAQVLALEANHEAMISIHPAYQVNVKNNRIIKRFYKGDDAVVLNVSEAVSSPDQYAPTASYLFRTDEFQSLPEWFFEARDLPFGDYFIESILGRKGLLYLPNIYSCYRRNVPGSYSERTSRSSVGFLITRMQAVLYYTSKLKDYPEISSASVRSRCTNVVVDYQNMALIRNSRYMFQQVSDIAKDSGQEVSIIRRFAANSGILFMTFRLSLSARRLMVRVVRGMGLIFDR